MGISMAQLVFAKPLCIQIVLYLAHLSRGKEEMGFVVIEVTIHSIFYHALIVYIYYPPLTLTLRVLSSYLPAL